MYAPLFHGHVTPAGHLALAPEEQIRRHHYLRFLAGHDVELVVRKRRTQRSLDQNAYLHAVPIPILAEHFGNTIPEMKYALMGECWGWKREPATGHEIPVKPHTSAMTVEECTYFIDWLIPWAMTQHGVAIPLPNEVALP